MHLYTRLVKKLNGIFEQSDVESDDAKLMPPQAKSKRIINKNKKGIFNKKRSPEDDTTMPETGKYLSIDN